VLIQVVKLSVLQMHNYHNKTCCIASVGITSPNMCPSHSMLHQHIQKSANVHHFGIMQFNMVPTCNCRAATLWMFPCVPVHCTSVLVQQQWHQAPSECCNCL